MPSRDPQWAVDHAELVALEARYAATWDAADAQGWADVFTPNGTFEITPTGDRPAIVVEGAERLATFCADFTATTEGVHLPALPHLEIDGDVAAGSVNFHFVGLTRLNEAHTVSRTASGTYRVRYLRTPAGWRMQHRVETALISSRHEQFGGMSA